jgi:DDE family transposase
MSDTLLTNDWKYVCQYLPDNLSDLAKACGAVDRWRNISSGEELLRIILAYAVDDLSLRSTAAWSTRSQLEMKDTSILHRLRKAPRLLELVLAHLLNHRLVAEEAEGPCLRINDATVLSIPGSQGTDWRIHAVYDPLRTRLLRVQITDASGGEHLKRDQPEPKDVVMADRGLARASGLHAVSQAGAYSLLRMHWQNIRLEDGAGNPLDLERVLAKAKKNNTGTVVYVPLEGTSPLPARLLVRPLPTELANRARAKLRRNASKKGRTPSQLALRLAGYFCLLTTLPLELANDEVVLELYRIRWQIELFFKRCKSLLHLNQLRALDPQLVQAYCLAKLIEVAMIQLLSQEGESFSPWGTPRRRQQAA